MPIFIEYELDDGTTILVEAPSKSPVGSSGHRAIGMAT
jgi:hypothetical protein